MQIGPNAPDLSKSKKNKTSKESQRGPGTQQMEPVTQTFNNKPLKVCLCVNAAESWLLCPFTSLF